MKTCPLSFDNIDANMARLNAFYIGLTVVIFLYNPNELTALFLYLDFLFRYLRLPQFSLTNFLAKQTQKWLGIESKMVDSGAKRYATVLGLLAVTLMGITRTLGYIEITYMISALLLVCIFLEVAFDYCIGCKLYYVLEYKRLRDGTKTN